MIKPNYSFEKRQRELAKKKKKAEKESRKGAGDETATEQPEPAVTPDASETTEAPEAPGQP